MHNISIQGTIIILDEAHNIVSDISKLHMYVTHLLCLGESV